MFGKRALCACTALAAMLLPWAMAGAEEECWTSKDDPYYHMEKDCPQAIEDYPISEVAAAAFDKAACPLCAAISGSADVPELRACMRGGTYVIRVPVELLAAAQISSDTGFSFQESYDGSEASDTLSEMLTDAEYLLFMAEFASSGEAQGVYRMPLPDTGEELLSMNVRLLDDAWYMVVRPDGEAPEDGVLSWRIVENRVEMDGSGALTVTCQGVEERRDAVESENRNDSETIFQAEYEGVRIDVYRAIGANIAVLHVDEADPDALQGEVRIGKSAQSGTPVQGYMDESGGAVYCCVITDSELGALVAGKTPVIWRESSLVEEGGTSGAQPSAEMLPATAFDW